MKPFEAEQNRARDERVEAMLREFFEQELPDELPPLLQARHETTQPPQQPVLRWLAPALTAAAGIAVLAAWGLWSSAANGPAIQTVSNADEPPNRHVVGLARTQKPKTSKASSVLSEPPPTPKQTDSSTDFAYSIFEAQQPLERFVYDTDSGPVEQRADVHWTTVTVYEPQSGDRTVWSLPELTIEVVSADQP